MTSSPISTANRQDKQGAPLAAAAGLPYAPDGERSPIDQWIDLMEAVEALCPRWPEQPQRAGRVYRL